MRYVVLLVFCFNHTAPTDIYTLSLHDALPISTTWRPPTAPTRTSRARGCRATSTRRSSRPGSSRSEEHTSELQSHSDLVCRLLLEKKKKEHSISHLMTTSGPVQKPTHMPLLAM